MIMKESEINNIYENLEKKIEAECKRMENKIPYWPRDQEEVSEYPWPARICSSSPVSGLMQAMCPQEPSSRTRQEATVSAWLTAI